MQAPLVQYLRLNLRTCGSHLAGSKGFVLHVPLIPYLLTVFVSYSRPIILLIMFFFLIFPLPSSYFSYFLDACVLFRIGRTTPADVFFTFSAFSCSSLTCSLTHMVHHSSHPSSPHSPSPPTPHSFLPPCHPSSLPHARTHTSARALKHAAATRSNYSAGTSRESGEECR